MKKLIVFLILFAMTVVCRAANEIHTNYPSAETLYAVVRNAAGQAWDPSDQAFENWPDATDDGDSAKQYDISLTDKSAGMYIGDFDSNVSAGRYYIQIWLQDGTDPNELDDALIDVSEIVWNGSAKETVIDSSGRTDVGTIEGTDATDQINAAADTAISDAALATAADLAIVDANVAAIQNDTETTLPATLTAIDDRIKTINTNVGDIVNDTETTLPATLTTIEGKIDTVDGNVDLILVDTGSTLDTKINTISTNIDDIETDTGTTLPATLSTIEGKIDTIDTNVDDIETDTGTTLTDKIDTIDTNVDDIETDTGTTLPATLAVIDTNVDDIETDTSTTLPATLTTMDGKLDTIDTNVDNIEMDTGTTLPATLATIDTNVDDIETDTGTTLPATLSTISGYVDGVESAIGTPVALDGGDATLGSMLTKLADDADGASFDATNNSLRGLQIHGDSNWTGSGGNLYTLNTDIAIGNTTTSFTLTDGEADDDAYNNGVLSIQDQNDSHWEDRRISDWTGDKVITVDTPYTFTPGVDDLAIIQRGSLAMSGSGTTPEAVRAELDNNSTQLAAIVEDTGTTLPTTLTTIEGKIDTIDTNVDDIETDTGTTIPATLSTISTNVDDIETDTGTTLPATLATIDGYLDTEIAAMKAVLDLFNFTGDDVKATLDSETVVLGSAGLNNISIADPAGVADSWPEMVVATWRWFYKKTDRTATEVRTYDDSGNTVRTTQAWSDDDTTQTIGAAQ